MTNLCNKSIIFTAASIAVFVIASDYSQAQGRARGGLRMGNVAAIQLLQMDEVQAELKLSAEQKEKANAAHDEFMTARRQIFTEVDKESGERGSKMKELKDKTVETLATVLDEAQRKRLREIILQVNGAAELDNQEIAADLKITPEQEKKLSEVRKANATARREALKALKEGGEGSRNEKLSELQKDGDKKLLEVLTPEQSKQFETLKGKEFKLDLFAA